MEFHVEDFDLNKHYEEICGWWRAQDWPEVATALLPKTGCIVSHRGINLAAGWVYLTNSQLAILEWVVANPNGEKEERSLAIDFLIEALKQKAIDHDYPLIFSYARNERLLKRYQDAEFQVTDTGMTHVMWRDKRWQ